jgi:hypothetical protein
MNQKVLLVKDGVHNGTLTLFDFFRKFSYMGSEVGSRVTIPISYYRSVTKDSPLSKSKLDELLQSQDYVAIYKSIDLEIEIIHLT